MEWSQTISDNGYGRISEDLKVKLVAIKAKAWDNNGREQFVIIKAN